MFWLRVKSIFLENKSLYISLFILSMALAIYFPSLGQDVRLIDKQDDLEKESLVITEKLDEAVLLRDDLLQKTQGLDSQVEAWEKRTETLKEYLTVIPDASKNISNTHKTTNRNKGLEDE